MPMEDLLDYDENQHAQLSQKMGRAPRIPNLIWNDEMGHVKSTMRYAQAASCGSSKRAMAGRHDPQFVPA
jgi:hypothetical protein